jgi:hypothetical protein
MALRCCDITAERTKRRLLRDEWRFVAITDDGVRLSTSEAFMSSTERPSKRATEQDALDELLRFLAADGWVVVRTADGAYGRHWYQHRLYRA